MGRRIFRAFTCIFLAILICTGLATIVVGASEVNEIVYIAGNDALYPVEYYDVQSHSYQGLMKDIYAYISAKYGYRFQYVSHAEQKKLVEDTSVMVVSSFVDGEINASAFRCPVVLMNLRINGEEKRICLAFTGKASQQLIDDVTEGLEEYTAQMRLESVVETTLNRNETAGTPVIMRILYALFGFAICAVVILPVVFLAKRRKIRGRYADVKYAMGNEAYLRKTFRNIENEKMLPFYYLGYIAFECDRIAKRFSDDEQERIEGYIADYLIEKKSTSDVLCRVDKGAFAIMYQAVNKDRASDRASALISGLRSYLIGSDDRFSDITAMCLCSLDDKHLCNADAAVALAKRCYYYALSSKRDFIMASSEIVERAESIEQIRNLAPFAVRNNEIKVHLQFIVDRATGTVCGAEALSRWQHPEEGLLMPKQYLELMKQLGLIDEHDFFIFEKVCRILENWKENGREHLALSCNFTRDSIASPNFVDNISKILERYRFDRSNLILEITEDSMYYDRKQSYENMRKCKEMGMMIAIDDLGSGSSTVQDLSVYPVDFVKVDSSVLHNAMESESGRKLLFGIIQFVHGLGFKLVCEGIETEAQNELILSTECDYIQGFYYSEVLPNPLAEDFVQKNT